MGDSEYLYNISFFLTFFQIDSTNTKLFTYLMKWTLHLYSCVDARPPSFIHLTTVLRRLLSHQLPIYKNLLIFEFIVMFKSRCISPPTSSVATIVISLNVLFELG